VLLFDAPLTFKEFMTHEDVPLASIFREALLYLSARDDAVLFGAQAVNAYCEPARMTADLDVVSTDAAGFADALREHLANRLHIATRVREVVRGKGFRVYQVKKPKNRHLVDVRQVSALPPSDRVEGVRVAHPAELLAMKVLSMVARRGREKELSDRLDAVRLLRAFPALKQETGVVSNRLTELGASADAHVAWVELVRQKVEADEDEGY
jgi:hypothetical protein